MKYYNIELLQTAAEKLQQLLYDLQIQFEISAAGAYYHFEILTDPASAAAVNNFLDNNTIYCAGVK